MGRGGKRLTERELGISQNTVNRGLKEPDSDSQRDIKSSKRQKKEGGGRKKAITDGIWRHIESFIQPHTRDDLNRRFNGLAKVYAT
jgi:hypothetical protein